MARKQPRRASPSKPGPRPVQVNYALAFAGLAVGLLLLYAGHYGNPLVFDDKMVNPVQIPGYARACLDLQTRCVSYATLAFTYSAVGLDIFWYRFGNVLAHLFVVLSAFLFFRRLFESVLFPSVLFESVPAPRFGSHFGSRSQELQRAQLLAFCGAALFAVNPVSVYGVGYLVQRSILLATGFSLLSLYALTRALTERSRWQLAASLGFYVLAVFSKEHAVGLPLVAAALAWLLGFRLRIRPWQGMAIAAAVLAIGISIGIFFLVRMSSFIGTAPEPFTAEILPALGPGTDAASAYRRSVITQALLFFRYLATWLLPYPGWMSIDMRVAIAPGLTLWPYGIAAVAYVAYGAAGVYLLTRRRLPGLAGFGLLYPWLLFPIEFASTRVQEPFVLYRAYLWMPGLIALLPVATAKLTPRAIVIASVLLAVGFAALTRERLQTFTSHLRLWDDVVQKNADLSFPFVDRGYSNRAVALLREGRVGDAERDIELALRLNPRSAYSFTNRAAIATQRGRDDLALADLDRATELDPNLTEAYSERCAIKIKRNDLAAARRDCEAALNLAPQWPAALLNRAVLNARRGDHAGALSDLEGVLRHDAGNAIALYNRGMVYRETGRPDAAAQDLRKSCRFGFAPACRASP